MIELLVAIGIITVFEVEFMIYSDSTDEIKNVVDYRIVELK